MWEILLGLVAYSQKNAAMINNPAFKFHFYGIYPSKIPQIRIYLYSNTNYTSTLFFRRSLGRIRQFSQIRALPHDASPTWLLWVLPHVSHASKYRHSTEATHEARLTSFVSFCVYSLCLHLFGPIYILNDEYFGCTQSVRPRVTFGRRVLWFLAKWLWAKFWEKCPLLTYSYEK